MWLQGAELVTCSNPSLALAGLEQTLTLSLLTVTLFSTPPDPHEV